MNIFTDMIRDILQCDIEYALQVQDYIDDLFLLDWSEASDNEIIKTVLDCHKEIQDLIE